MSNVTLQKLAATRYKAQAYGFGEFLEEKMIQKTLYPHQAFVLMVTTWCRN